MGFFKNIFKKPLKGIKKVAVKATAAVATGGLSLVNKKIGRTAEGLAGNFFPTSPQQLLKVGLGVATKNPSFFLPSGTNSGRNTMAFDIGGFLGQVGGILGKSSIGGLQNAGAVASLASSFVPKQTAMAKRPALPSPSKGPINGPKPMGGLLSSAKAVGRSFFQKYPNLATAIQRYRNAGMSQVTRGKLYQLLKRFGPELIISGGILTAAAVSELMMAGPGYRRMNPANVKALRRSVRRLEGFHKLCVHVDRLRRPRSRKGSRVGSGSTFVRQG